MISSGNHKDCYHKGLVLDPGDPGLLNDLGWFLIENNRNIDEGMMLVDSALKINPDNYNYLESKGLGFYKQGKYKKAFAEQVSN